jgi:hypothetical protein
MARSDGGSFYLMSIASLIAAGEHKQVESPGLTSGFGAQGSANTANMVGQSGTGADQLSLPRRGGRL